MPSRFSLNLTNVAKRPRDAVRLGLGFLLLLNLVAAYFVWQPPGGSVEQLTQQAATLRSQIANRRVSLERAKLMVEKATGARDAGDQFLTKFFLDRRTASSTLLSELGAAAKTAGIQPREHAFAVEPIEGTDALEMITITANYEGTYADLIEFVNLLDRSGRLLILETLQAQPLQAAGTLGIQLKINAFVRTGGAV